MLSQVQRQTFDQGINAGLAHANHLGDLLSSVPNLVKGSYDFSKVGGAIGTFNLKDDDGNDVVVPSGALITNVALFAKAAVTSLGSATLALASEGAGDLLAATGKASFTLSAKLQGVPVANDATTGVLLTADRKLVLSVAVAALTAGKVYAYVSYVLT